MVKEHVSFNPPLWSDYDLRHKVAASTPFFNKAAEVNRFQARYRLARAFRGLILEGYSEPTKSGYEGLTKVTLYWSAFEQMLNALNTHERKIVDTYNYVSDLARIEHIDRERRLFGFVRGKVNRRDLRTRLDEYIANGKGSVLLLSKCVRHIYLHGHLTANVRGLSPHDIQSICEFLCDVLLRVMDDEFEARVLDLKQVYE